MVAAAGVLVPASLAQPPVTLAPRVFTVTVSSSAMEPTLHCAQPGIGCEAAFADSLVVRSPVRRPMRGAILLIRTGRSAADRCGASGLLVERLVGLPGETVEERLVNGSGYMFVNNRRLREPYIRPGRRGQQTYGPLRVPRGRYFFMGDNRGQSCDSRVWGTLPRVALIGAVTAIRRVG